MSLPRKIFSSRHEISHRSRLQNNFRPALRASVALFHHSPRVTFTLRGPAFPSALFFCCFCQRCCPASSPSRIPVKNGRVVAEGQGRRIIRKTMHGRYVRGPARGARPLLGQLISDLDNRPFIPTRIRNFERGSSRDHR